jgi:hypothetical protein
MDHREIPVPEANDLAVLQSTAYVGDVVRVSFVGTDLCIRAFLDRGVALHVISVAVRIHEARDLGLRTPPFVKEREDELLRGVFEA